MSKKHTYEYVKEYIESLGYELISKEYNGNKSNLIIKDILGYIYYVIFNNIIKQKGEPYKFSPHNPYTIENIKLWLKLNNINLELLSKDYIKCDQKLLLKDTKGYYYNTSSNNLFSGNVLRKFDLSNSYTIQNIELWCKLNDKPFELIKDQIYKGNGKKLKWRCLKENCGEIFEASLNPILQDGGCGVCHGKQVGLFNCLATINPELAKQWDYKRNGNLTPYDVPANSRTEVYWKCPICNYNWKRKIATRNNGGGCPICNESHGEKEISRVFKLHDVFYEPQKSFKGLIGLGNGLLSYDFYIPNKYNFLIEYQGEQHEKYIPGFHKSKKDFEKQVEHDKRKREYAKSNNINLLEIWYWDFDRIEEILIKELNLNDIKLAI